MTEEKKTKLGALARTIVCNPDRDPRMLIAQTRTEAPDFDYLDKQIEALTATQAVSNV